MCQPSVIVRLNGTICKRRFCTVSMVFVIDIAVLDSAVSLLISYVTQRDVTGSLMYHFCTDRRTRCQ